MNREEKNLKTRGKIIDSALAEFSEKSYGEASLNTICAAGALSKGSIYHYFRDKDELYLVCVKESFDALTRYLSNMELDKGGVEASLQLYFNARMAFFNQHPLYLGIFYSARINPPPQLEAAIKEITAEFQALSISILTKLLGTVTLRPDVTIDEIVEVFCEYQDFVNTRFRVKAPSEATLKIHEEKCRRSLQILLYGAIERGV